MQNNRPAKQICGRCLCWRMSNTTTNNELQLDHNQNENNHNSKRSIYAEQPTCKANMWTVPLSEEQHNHSSPQLKLIQWIRACNVKQSLIGKKVA